MRNAKCKVIGIYFTIKFIFCQSKICIFNNKEDFVCFGDDEGDSEKSAKPRS